MNQIKVVIELNEDNEISVYSNCDLKFVLIDKGRNNEPGNLLDGPFHPEIIEDNLYTLYNGSEEDEKEIRDELKRLKF